MKKIEVEIPEGKEVKWIDNALTLVDEQPKSIMDRVKSYEDACKVLGIEDYLNEPNPVMSMMGIEYGIPKNIIARMKLNVIVEALNEGWVAAKAENINDRWWYPWFYRFNEGNENKYRGYNLARSYYDSDAFGGVAYAGSIYDLKDANPSCGSRLALKSEELADYCGKQFIQLWADYLLG